MEKPANMANDMVDPKNVNLNFINIIQSKEKESGSKDTNSYKDSKKRDENKEKS